MAIKEADSMVLEWLDEWVNNIKSAFTSQRKNSLHEPPTPSLMGN